MGRSYRCDVCGETADPPEQKSSRGFALPANWYRINSGDSEQTFRREACSVECALIAVEELAPYGVRDGS